MATVIILVVGVVDVIPLVDVIVPVIVFMAAWN